MRQEPAVGAPTTLATVAGPVATEVAVIVLLDMDDVLVDAFAGYSRRYEDRYGEPLTEGMCAGIEVHEAVPADRRAEVESWPHEPGFFRDLPPMGGSVAAVEQLSARHEVVIASAAMEYPSSLRDKSDWLDEHLPAIAWTHRVLCGAKGFLRGDVLVDDRGYNLDAFDGRGLLFTAHHNLGSTDHERVAGWDDVVRLLG